MLRRRWLITAILAAGCAGAPEPAPVVAPVTVPAVTPPAAAGVTLPAFEALDLPSRTRRWEALPPLDQPIQACAPPLQELITRARTFVTDPVPSPGAAAADAEAYGRWLRMVLTDWIRRRSEGLREGERLTRSLDFDIDRHRVVAAAVMAIMYLDLVDTLGLIQPPSELARDPEVLDAYRAALDEQAAPYREQARVAFRACAAAAEEAGSDWSRWGDFCLGQAASSR